LLLCLWGGFFLPNGVDFLVVENPEDVMEDFGFVILCCC
jgi:hypothetical protein